ncbi:MAG: DUF1887 family protein [Deltaproteobacteria bacterium]
MTIHVCLVSDQTLPNLIPALMFRPDLVVLVTSAAMERKGIHARLKDFLAKRGIDTDIRLKAPEAGIQGIHSYALDLLVDVKHRHPGAKIVLNATGGTKPMALAFVEVFRGEVEQIIYVDTANRRIEYLPQKEEGVQGPTTMGQVFDVPSYLEAQGFQYECASSDSPARRDIIESRKAISSYLAKQAKKPDFQNFLGAMNGLAEKALDEDQKLVSPVQALGQSPWGIWADALKRLQKAGLLKWEDGSREIEFLDEDTLRYLHGGWLEEYAWHTVREAGVHDVRLGVRGKWMAARTSANEIDVLACHNNQLLYIECKTRRHNEEKDSNIAYKTGSLGRDLRGLFGNTWLLSARQPSDDLLGRARQANFKVIGPQDLCNLGEEVRRWKNA